MNEFLHPTRRPAPPSQPELVVTVGTGTTGDVDDPRMGALAQQGQ
jgi:hypothetical protein